MGTSPSRRSLFWSTPRRGRALYACANAGREGSRNIGSRAAKSAFDAPDATCGERNHIHHESCGCAPHFSRYLCVRWTCRVGEQGLLFRPSRSSVLPSPRRLARHTSTVQRRGNTYAVSGFIRRRPCLARSRLLRCRWTHRPARHGSDRRRRVGRQCIRLPALDGGFPILRDP